MIQDEDILSLIEIALEQMISQHRFIKRLEEITRKEMTHPPYHLRYLPDPNPNTARALLTCILENSQCPKIDSNYVSQGKTIEALLLKMDTANTSRCQMDILQTDCIPSPRIQCQTNIQLYHRILIPIKRSKVVFKEEKIFYPNAQLVISLPNIPKTIPRTSILPFRDVFRNLPLNHV